MPADRPNIIIYMPDQWRGDYIGAAGHPFVRTPNHDRFAEEGMVFTRAFTTHPICGPSRCSFCTGWYPHTRGHRSQEYLIRHDEPHLFRYLQEAGYHVAWSGKNDMLEADLVEETVDQRLSPQGDCTVWGENPYERDDPRFYSFYHGRLPGSVEDHRDGQLVRAAQRFLREDPPEPFCLFVTPGFPHPPYAAPEPYFSMYDPEEVGPPVHCEYGGMPDFMEKLSHYSGLDRVEEGLVRRIRALYCGMITMMDDLLGDLSQTMHEEGLADRTAFFSTSDHGNYAGDYGMPTKWHTGYHDALVRVPMAVRLPDGEGRGVSDALVQHIDVFGTVLDLLDIQPEWAHYARSTLPVMNGESDAIRDAVFAESGYNHPHEVPYCIARMGMRDMPETNPYYSFYQLFMNHPHTAARTMMMRTERWKYVWRQRDVDELYDLESDPQETRNLLADPTPQVRERRREMLEGMLAWQAGTGDVMPVGV